MTYSKINNSTPSHPNISQRSSKIMIAYLTQEMPKTN